MFTVERTSCKKKKKKEGKNHFKLNLVGSIESNNDRKKERRGKESEGNGARATRDGGNGTEENGPRAKEKEREREGRKRRISRSNAGWER